MTSNVMLVAYKEYWKFVVLFFIYFAFGKWIQKVSNLSASLSGYY
jgi:hypothetical protein